MDFLYLISLYFYSTFKCLVTLQVWDFNRKVNSTQRSLLLEKNW